MAKVIVVGAGVAGLLAAHALRNNGHAVTLFDKSYVPGGRLASKTVDGATFDIGAQFFTARSELFRAHVDRWLAAGVARTWFHGTPDLTPADRGTEPSAAHPHGPDGHPRYRGAPTMRRLAEHLADGLELHLGTIVGSIAPAAGGFVVRTTPRAPGSSARPVWRAATSSPDRRTDLHHADAVLLATPVPQATDILTTGGTPLSPAVQTRLASIGYTPTITVLAVPDAAPTLPDRGAVRLLDGDIEWITDNHATGASSRPAITIHTGARFARAYADADDAEVAHATIAAARDVLACELTVVHVHRWRYATPTSSPDATPLMDVVDGAPLAFAGDAFQGGRVEGAARSGLASAAALHVALPPVDRST